MKRYIKICNKHRKDNGLSVKPGKVDCPNGCPAAKTCPWRRFNDDFK
ncbi:MAG: hypothetical protein WC581_11420 [Thermodesulfovibrionales bacterium]